MRLVALLLCLVSWLWSVTASAGTTDGTLLGVTTLLDSGDPRDKIDVTFVGDGFTAAEQELFNQRVQDVVDNLLAAHPFNALHCAFNIHRVNVASRESGTDVPATCNDGTSSTPRSVATAMDTTYCQGSVFRCVGTPDPSEVVFWTNKAPGADVTLVLVNDGGYGGCAFGNVTFETLDSGLAETVVHELGHGLGGLGDEYSDDDPGQTTFTGTEPMAANLTVSLSRNDLKWGDLVLPSTPIPTSTCQLIAAGGGCGSVGSPQPFDLVGAFPGGAMKFSCGIMHPSSDCRMRHKDKPFCSVCRRRLIQRIRPNLCRSSAVTLTQLLVKDDQDPWPRGAGDIYFNYAASSNGASCTGRWPGASGDVGFDDGDEKSLGNFFLGEVSEPRAGTTGNVSVQVRDSDWPDGDDALSGDASFAFSSPMPATFEIDQPDYRLRGALTPANLKVLLDTIHIKDDMDDLSQGDIFVNYWISNGPVTISGRWPSGDGDVGISTGDSHEIGIYAGAVSNPLDGGSLTVRIQVWDADSFLTGDDDLIGDDTFSFDGSTGFGTHQIVHIEDRDNYRITFSLVANPR